MLAYDPDDAPPVRKLLHMVLLMAVRDGAAVVRFEPCRDTLRMWYFVSADWYELVPVPGHVWPTLRATVLAVANTQPLPPAQPWAEASDDVWTAGTLDHQVGARTVRWALMLDDRRHREGLTLTATSPAAPPGEAAYLLRVAMSGADAITFQ